MQILPKVNQATNVQISRVSSYVVTIKKLKELPKQCMERLAVQRKDESKLINQTFKETSYFFIAGTKTTTTVPETPSTFVSVTQKDSRLKILYEKDLTAYQERPLQSV